MKIESPGIFRVGGLPCTTMMVLTLDGCEHLRSPPAIFTRLVS